MLGLSIPAPVCTWHPRNLTCDLCGTKREGALIGSTAICGGCIDDMVGARNRHVVLGCKHRRAAEVNGIDTPICVLCGSLLAPKENSTT